MEYGIIILLAAGMVYFLMRYYLLRRAVSDVKEQLEEITAHIRENQIVRLPGPEKELEGLLTAINRSLYEIRQERNAYAGREKAFQRQIENISHDLRTPLTAMIGYLKLMDVSSFPAEEQENRNIILRKAEVLQRLIAQFYDFSRLTAEDYVLHTERVDAARLLRELLMDAYPELSARNLEVTAELPEQPVWVLGDSDAMQRIFQNLLQNAGRYAAGSLELSFAEEEEQAVFFFRNDTEQIEEADVERFFERFYTADEARSSGSTGLGLTIAKELAEKMGGKLSAKLEDGKWLKISCTFKKA